MTSTPLHTFIIVPALFTALAAASFAADRPDPLAPYTGIPEGYILVQGDMLYRIDGGRGVQSAFERNMWPGFNIPYEFDANVTADNQQAMRLAMAEIESVCAVRFVPRDGEDDYVHILAHDSKNSSQVGCIGGEQIVNIMNWGTRFIMVHELMHTLGFMHEMSRADRDFYVTIHFDRIESGEEHNYYDDGDLMYGPYDFDSLMHYGQCSTSTCEDCLADPANCRTITVKPPYADQWQDRIGQQDHLSRVDIATLQCTYPYNLGNVFVDDDPSAYDVPEYPLGTFFNPYRTFLLAESVVPVGGTVMIQPGNYTAIGRHSKPMRLGSPLGGVKLGN